MEPTEIQARATIAAALILKCGRSTEHSDKWRLVEGYCRSPAARSHRLRLPDDCESTASLIHRAEPTSHPHVIWRACGRVDSMRAESCRPRSRSITDGAGNESPSWPPNREREDRENHNRPTVT